MDNTCVFCGAVIPEGRQVCPVCERTYRVHCGLPVEQQAMDQLLRQSAPKEMPDDHGIIPYLRKENRRCRSWTKIICRILCRKQNGQKRIRHFREHRNDDKK